MQDCLSFSFLVTTDNHMGYKKDDHILRKDSFMAFEEALEVARERDVDFILLGGDLFHENRPSAAIEHKCMKIIRQHMNKVNRPTSFRKISGEFSHYHKVHHANFEDENLSVSHPIMTIHGNHDDPTGPHAQSVCEKLATCGLLNYFGKINSPSTYLIAPIVLQKGEKIKIALYGLGFIPDYKLKVAFEAGKVIFKEPPPDTYNVLVVHQNRVPFSKNKVIPDELFPDFFHLIIRGHEHDTHAPEQMSHSKIKGFVYQPGSTVATSLAAREAMSKSVGIITIKLNSSRSRDLSNLYKMEWELISLKSIRRMFVRDISHKDIGKYIKLKTGEKRVSAQEFKAHCRDYVEKVVEDLLAEHKTNQLKLDNPRLIHFKLPLMRLRLEYTTKQERFDDLLFGSRYYPARVANKDIVLYKKQKLSTAANGELENQTFLDDDLDEDQADIDFINLDDEKRDTIDVMIEDYFNQRPPDQRLQALSITEYTNAVNGSHEDGNVISKVLKKKKQELLQAFKSALTSEKVAAKDFHNQEVVEKWFTQKLKANEKEEETEEDKDTAGSDEEMEVDEKSGGDVISID